MPAVAGYPSVDRPWLKYYDHIERESGLVGHTVFENIRSENEGHERDVALEYFGRRVTYAELFENVECVKNALHAWGVVEGDNVVLYLTSTPEFVYLSLALARIGAVANIINPMFSETECEARINETGARILFLLDRLHEKAVRFIPNTCVERVVVIPVSRSMPGIKRFLANVKFRASIQYDHATISWSEFLHAAGEGMPDARYKESRPMVVVYSSGSTGASKGIVLTHDGINSTIRHYISPDFPYVRGDTFLQMIPVWFSTGIVLSVLMPLCVGITVILEPVFSKETFAADLRKYNPNMTLAATSLWVHVLKTCTDGSFTLDNMKYPATGGELVLPRTEKALNGFLRAHGAKSQLLTAYGMCELGSTITTDSNTYHKMGASGYPMTGVIVAAFDTETDRELPFNRRGELRVYSPARMKGYFKNPEATRAFFKTDEEGRVWGCTGDMGYVDEDGFVYVQGRLKDSMIRANGERAYLFDIELAILNDDRVAQCKVVQVEARGERELVAHLVLEPEASEAIDVLEHINMELVSVLPSDMVPVAYKIWDRLPVSPSGKLDLRALSKDRSDVIYVSRITRS